MSDRFILYIYMYIYMFVWVCVCVYIRTDVWKCVISRKTLGSDCVPGREEEEKYK